MQLTPEALHDFQQDVLKRYPEEACGLIVSAKYRACSNASKTPESDFYIQATELLHASSEGTIQAVLHSHPYHLAPRDNKPAEWPSQADMTGWLADNLPWGIVATDGSGCSPVMWMDDNDRPPLLDRDFIHGVNDCYSLIRDWFREERGVILKNFARGWDWWHQGDDLYSKNFESAGFKVITPQEATIGDCVMYKIRSPVTNHAAVIVGPDTILHHYHGHKSCLKKRSTYNASATHHVRYAP